MPPPKSGLLLALSLCRAEEQRFGALTNARTLHPWMHGPAPLPPSSPPCQCFRVCRVLVSCQILVHSAENSVQQVCVDVVVVLSFYCSSENEGHSSSPLLWWSTKVVGVVGVECEISTKDAGLQILPSQGSILPHLFRFPDACYGLKQNWVTEGFLRKPKNGVLFQIFECTLKLNPVETTFFEVDNKVDMWTIRSSKFMVQVEPFVLPHHNTRTSEKCN